ncbi:YEATS domain-containing protein 4, partial [Microtus ochrogaster]
VTIVKPIVYGNVARYFGKKREEDGHTHQWTVYVKPYRNEDMSAYVKKIQFKLHESYGNPLRVVTKPPYEITETGWGEFEIIIKIFFIDPNERPGKAGTSQPVSEKVGDKVLPDHRGTRVVLDNT